MPGKTVGQILAGRLKKLTRRVDALELALKRGKKKPREEEPDELEDDAETEGEEAETEGPEDDLEERYP